MLTIPQNSEHSDNVSHCQKQQLLSHVRRAINCLKEKEPSTRRNAIAELHKIVTEKVGAASLFEEIMHMGLKEIIKCYYDHLETVRERAVNLTIEMISRCNNIKPFLPYIFEALKDRTNCVDLDGIDKLPEKIRPNPGQKPKVMLKINEACEQIRVLYCSLIKRIIGLLEQDKHEMARHLDDAVNILRALIMDPAPEIQRQACEVMVLFCNEYKDILLHFTETMGRAVLLPLISKKSKIRIAGLEALTAIFWCGLWKYNAFVFENLIGFRDPNSVPIKDFYEPSNNINYLATFIIDPNVKVRQEFLKHLKIWICDLNDKYDHHGKLVPYLLSGLFDPDEKVRETALAAVVEIGSQIQVQKEKEFRENKQFAIDAAWTWEGKLVNLPVEPPLTSRPSLGSRYFIRGHVRKFWPALYKQVKDLNEQNRVRSANLALFGVIFNQNYLTQFMDNFVPQLLPCILPTSSSDKRVPETICKIFYYVGRYCEVSSYLHLIKSALDGKLIQNQEFIKCAMKGLAKLVEGSLDAIPEGENLCHKKDYIIEVLNMLQECEIAGDVYNFNCVEAKEISVSILKGIVQKASQTEKEEILSIHFLTLIKLISVSYFEELYYSGFSLKSSQKPEVDQSTSFSGLLSMFDQLHEAYPKGFEDIQDFLSNLFCNPPSLMDSDWKLLTIFYRYLCIKGATDQNCSNLFLVVQETMCECLSQNKSIELLAFAIKFIYNLIVTLPNQHKTCILNKSDQLLKESMRNLETFKPIKKVPVYDEHLNRPDENPSALKTAQQNVFHLFAYSSKAMSGYFGSNIPIDPMQLASLFESYLLCFKKVFRNKDSEVEAIRAVWAIFEKLEIGEGFSNKFNSSDKPESPKFMLPQIIDFCVERLQEYLEPRFNKMVFDVLGNVVKAWPKVSKITEDLSSVYPDFPDLLEKFFKYSMNERDPEIKQHYLNLLEQMAKKMPQWFRYEYNRAQQEKRFEKIKLIQQVIHNSNI